MVGSGMLMRTQNYRGLPFGSIWTILEENQIFDFDHILGNQGNFEFWIKLSICAIPVFMKKCYSKVRSGVFDPNPSPWYIHSANFSVSEISVSHLLKWAHCQIVIFTFSSKLLHLWVGGRNFWRQQKLTNLSYIHNKKLCCLGKNSRNASDMLSEFTFFPARQVTKY